MLEPELRCPTARGDQLADVAWCTMVSRRSPRTRARDTSDTANSPDLAIERGGIALAPVGNPDVLATFDLSSRSPERCPLITKKVEEP
jgi:hypothetical protein